MRVSSIQAGERASRRVPLGSRYGLSVLAVSALAIVISGCKPVGPNYKRPGYDAPPAYKETGASSAVVPPPNPAGGGWVPASPSDGMLRGKW